MNETLKRAIFGAVYVAIMWIGASSSETSCRFLFSVLGIVSVYEMWKLRKGRSKFIAYLYVLLPFSLIQLLISDFQVDNVSFNSSLILSMFIFTWTFDTFAYLFGVKFGKHKIMPSISPKKSWEGFVGGYIFTIVAAYITSRYFLPIDFHLALIVSLFLPFTATIGDFIESHYKREAGVKDSGNLIPGHGGMLDRMDAFMITIPVLYILTNLL
jgi:phosphatidate cytidylyltransferase